MTGRGYRFFLKQVRSFLKVLGYLHCRKPCHTLQWIEDFVLLCRLVVPVCAPHTRFLSVTLHLRGTLPQQGSFLPKHRRRRHTATSIASIRLDLRLAKCPKIRYIRLTFKNMRRAQHTPRREGGRMKSGAFCHAFHTCAHVRRYMEKGEYYLWITLYMLMQNQKSLKN